MRTKKFSVIIPVYRNHMLGRALKSIECQKEKPYEVLVIIDGLHGDEFDELVKICKKSSLDLKMLHNETNEGAAAARNHGLRKSQGNLIAFLDSDDYWDDSFLEEHAKAHEIYPKCSIVTCHSRILNEKYNGGDNSKKSYRLRDYTDCLLLQRLPTPCTTIKTKELYEYFDTSLSCAEDLQFFLSNIYLGHKRCLLIQKNLVVEGRRRGSKGGLSANRFQMHKNAGAVYRKIYRRNKLTGKEKIACLIRMTYHKIQEKNFFLLNCLKNALATSV